MILKNILPWYGHWVICIYRIALEMIGKSPCNELIDDTVAD